MPEASNDLPPCIVCGAKRGEPCRQISTYGDHQKGDIRPEPHFYRAPS